MKGANTARGRRREKRRATAKVAHIGVGIIEDKIVTVQGRVWIANTTAVQFAEIIVSPANFDDRCFAMADLYQLWRPKAITFKCVSIGTTANFMLGHVSVDSVTGGYPNTVEEMVDLPAFSMGCGTFGNPVPHLVLDEKYWRDKSLPQWFTTQNVPVDPLFENAGILQYACENATFATQNFRGLIEWEFEFRGMLDPQVSAERVAARKYPDLFPPLDSKVQDPTPESKEEGKASAASSPASGQSAWSVLPRVGSVRLGPPVKAGAGAIQSRGAPAGK